ncbi:MAG: ATP-binding protein [bacterium]|nr:ATP-binding protein [bacterium]
MTRFRARARAVDMLGRQQIASLPTALSELFKNSYDAYATVAIADFFRSHNVLVVSDDGVGMDRETFEKHWLTIATESKLERGSTSAPPGMRPRVQLGEKGIGRLAIGALGSQVLVVSKRDGHPAVAALVSWKMFELPRVDLDEVPVGLVELDSGDLTAADVGQLKTPIAEAVANFRALDTSASWSHRMDEILATLDAIPDDPYRALPDLEPIRTSGTVFLISPVSEDLPPELESPRAEDASSLERTLHGFTDVWLGSPTTPEFSVDFVDHRYGGDDESLLQPGDFFGTSDFESADHHVLGEFDENGNFLGTIRIFDEEPTDVDIPCPKPLRPRCGCFAFELGVVQGERSESRLEPDAFATMTTRLRQLGGLYVYMDGIRVQPYGRPDVDYLEIEERRTLGAGYYYFSYRRMFGAVSLSTEHNNTLQEKAGREGFTQGRAYSDFRGLLINLFVELAATFFRAESPRVGAYEKGRQRLAREDALRKERDKRAREGRRRLRAQLAGGVQYLNETNFQQETAGIVQTLAAELDTCDRLQPASQRVAAARWALRQLTMSLEFDEPEGFAPTEPMRRDMTTLERGIEEIERSYVRPALETVDDLVATTEKRLAALEADERERREFVEGRISQARSRVSEAQGEAGSALAGLATAVRATLAGLREDFNRQLDAIAVPTTSTSSGWIQDQARFEQAVDALATESRRALIRVVNLVQSSRLVFSSGAPDPTELAAAADAEIVELRAQADAQLELVQLGMALAVVDHEFQATISSIRSDVRRVGAWAKKNPQLVRLYEDLRRDIDHLESYLTLLTPMQRRLRRTPTTIKGSDISRYLDELFRDRLADVGVEIRPSREFQAARLEGYTSTFYPVFINLVDNSLYWIQRDSAGSTQVIELDKRGDTLVYRDSGPGITADIADRVFDFGFTTKPGGSGLGLAIASQVLERAGWSIHLGDRDGGTEFLIRPRIKERERRR